jgi:hypothetical protein
LLFKNDIIREYIIVGVIKKNWLDKMSALLKYIKENHALPTKSSPPKIRLLFFWLVNTKERYMRKALDAESIQLLLAEPLIREFLKNKRKRRILPQL